MDKLLSCTIIFTSWNPTQCHKQKKFKLAPTSPTTMRLRSLPNKVLINIPSPIPHFISLPTQPCIVAKFIIFSIQHDVSIHNLTNLKLDSLMSSTPMLPTCSNMSTNGYLVGKSSTHGLTPSGTPRALSKQNRTTPQIML